MVIKSLLDTDLYKFTMQQVAWKFYPQAQAKFKFICRNKGLDLSPFVEEINQEVSNLCTLKFSEPEINFLREQGVFSEEYLKFLTNFKLNRNQIKVSVKNKQLSIEAEGPWHESIMFEVFVLSIVNEVYFRNTQPQVNYNIGRIKLLEKIELISSLNNSSSHPFKLTDFGTRRRFSSFWQGQVVQTLKENLKDSFIGTSSVYWAFKLKTKPIGTMAHEYFQAHQVLGKSLLSSQKDALEVWLKAYQGKLAIALSDIYGTEPFLKDFTQDLASQYLGVRHDSGDPFVWGEKIIQHYQNMGIDPKTKTLVFSDGLDIPKAIALHNKFIDRIQVIFGIGTNLTNDFNFPALNIVMKMVSCNNSPVAKISDEPSKAICDDPEFLKLVKQTFGINQ